MPADPIAVGYPATGAELQALRADVHNAEAARRRTTLIAAALGVLLLVLVLLLISSVWRGNRVLYDLERRHTVAADCVIPGGNCFTERQRHADAANANGIRVSIYAAQCARLYPNESGPNFDRKLEQCVAERLSAAAPLPGPTPVPSPRPTR